MAVQGSPTEESRLPIASSATTVSSRAFHDGGGFASAGAALTTRDDISVGIDWTTLSDDKDLDVFTLALSNTTRPGPTDLLYAVPDGYRFLLPWWTGIPGAILNLFIALRILVIDSWRWKGQRNERPFDGLEQSESHPAWTVTDVGEKARIGSVHPVPRSPSPPTSGYTSRPKYVFLVDTALRYLQLAYLLVQVLAGLAYVAENASGHGSSNTGTKHMRFAGPAAYCLLFAVVCQMWSALFIFFSPALRRWWHSDDMPGNKKRFLWNSQLLHPVILVLLSGITAVVAICVFFILTVPPVSRAPTWQVWSPWCVPYGYIGQDAAGSQNASASGWRAGEFVYKAPAGTGTPSYPTGADRWPCADAAGLSLYQQDVSIFPRHWIDPVFGTVMCVLLLAAFPQLFQLKAWRRQSVEKGDSKYTSWIANGIMLLLTLVTCVFAALKFYDMAKIGDSWYFHGSYLVCPGLVNTTSEPFNVSGIGLCFGVQVQLPAVAQDLRTILDMDKSNLAQLIFNI